MNKIEIFQKIDRSLLEENKPSIKILKILEDNRENFPFSMIYDLKSVPQEPKHHPEGDVLVHTMMVIDEAAKRRELSENKRVLMWSALLHDIGKKSTTKQRKGRWTSYDHDKVGEKQVMDFFASIDTEEVMRSLAIEVSKITRYHMQSLFVIKNMPFKDMEGIKRMGNVQELALLSLSDRLGRGGLKEGDRLEVTKQMNYFLEKVSEYSGEEYKKFNDDGYSYE